MSKKGPDYWMHDLPKLVKGVLKTDPAGKEAMRLAKEADRQRGGPARDEAEELGRKLAEQKESAPKDRK